MTTTLQPEQAGKGLSTFSILTGILFAVVAAAGLIGVGAHLLIVLTSLLDGSLGYSLNFAIYNALWIIFFLSLLIAGINLIISGARKKRHNLVPGISLYLAGASLIMLSFYLFVYDDLRYAVIALVVGLVLMLVEWFSETV